VPVELAGTTIPAGSLLQLCLASANRDDTEFHEPDQFLLRPGGTTPLSFGRGTHSCIGFLLARAEASVLAEEMRNFKLEISQKSPPPPSWSFRPAGNLYGRIT